MDGDGGSSSQWMIMVDDGKEGLFTLFAYMFDFYPLCFQMIIESTGRMMVCRVWMMMGGSLLAATSRSPASLHTTSKCFVYSKIHE